MDASLLYSYESARSQLNYGAAYKVVMAFGLNPKWLATGNGNLSLPISIPSPKELGVGTRALFSKIYDKHVAKPVAAATKEWKSRSPPEPISLRINAADPRNRLTAEAKMVDWIKRLILCLPDERLEPFLNFIYLEGTKLYRTWPADTKQAIEKRAEAMDRARLAMEASKNFLVGEQTAALKKFDQQYSLTDAATSDRSDGVKSEWLKLKNRIQEATADAGSKSKLADFLRVDLTQLSKWLTDSDSAREPGADYTLQLLKWVEQQERQK
jgi:hypothetical protein